jgi:transketolase
MPAVEGSATRDAYGEALAELARADRNVVALDCDLGRSTRSYAVAEVDPERFVEMGIAEQDMISTAAGMARMGKVVFVNSFAVFVTGHAFDQIRQQVALPKSNVKICGSSAGITQGTDGATHQSVVDAALMRALPNMTVIVPADARQTRQAVRAAYELPGPVYLRLSRLGTGDFLPADARFELGQAQVLRSGARAALVGCGPVLRNVLEAADFLRDRHGVAVGVVNCHTLKPFDADTIRRLAGQCEHILSVEEHSILGGLGSAVAEALAESPDPGRRAVLTRLGLRDCFGESGSAEELLRKHGLDVEGIVRSVLQALG